MRRLRLIPALRSSPILPLTPARETGGVLNAIFVFALPGSPGACRDTWDHILAPQFDYRHKPCNFVEIMPRLDEHLRRGGGRSA